MRGGGAEPPAHTQQAEGHVQRHAAHARQPDGGQLIQQRKALCRSGSCHFQALLRRGGNIGLFLLAKLLIGLDGRAFGLLEADGALYCQSGGKQQPQGHQQPQHTHGAAGRTAQQRPHRHHRQRDEARLPGNFQYGGKQAIHFLLLYGTGHNTVCRSAVQLRPEFFCSKRSIMAWSTSASSLESFEFPMKAVRNAGKLP